VDGTEHLWGCHVPVERRRLIGLPEWLATAVASDAGGGKGILPAAIRPLVRGARIAGPAFTIQASTDDNSALNEAARVPPPRGSVLVVAGHEQSRAATIGGLLALEFHVLGVAALVTDGVVRDSDEIVELGLPVWARGVTPLAPQKLQPGQVGVPIDIGGTVIETGDIVIADDDGVVVWPKAEVEELLTLATARNDADLARAFELRS
jgi:4-hydroxy-4-methyl-2-oxoglutarate aldolase